MGNRTVATDALTGTLKTSTDKTDTKHLDKSADGDAEQTLEQMRDSLNANVSYDLNDPALKKFISDTAFMEEEVLVRVATTTDPNALKLVEVWCNGTPQRFIRGEFVIAKRKYVAVLAQAKPFAIDTPEYVDANGDRATKIQKTYGDLYPFEMRDRNPKGDAWLAHLRNEA